MLIPTTALPEQVLRLLAYIIPCLSYSVQSLLIQRQLLDPVQRRVSFSSSENLEELYSWVVFSYFFSIEKQSFHVNSTYIVLDSLLLLLLLLFCIEFSSQEQKPL